MAANKTPRRRAREFVIQGVYQKLMNPDSSAQKIEQHLRENQYFVKADNELFQKVFYGVLQDQSLLLDELVPLLDRPVAEVNPVELSALLMACFELKETPEVPYPVVINEAIEAAKIYGGTDGYKFVNGIVDKLAAKLRQTEFQMKNRR